MSDLRKVTIVVEVAVDISEADDVGSVQHWAVAAAAKDMAHNSFDADCVKTITIEGIDR